MAWKRDKDATQPGGVLGVGGANPPSDRSKSNPAVTGTSGRNTGSTVSDDADRNEKSATGSLKQSKGATGIDMGAGGEGTDIKP